LVASKKSTQTVRSRYRLHTYIIVVLLFSCIRKDFEVAYECGAPKKASKGLLLRNKVKSITERHCFPNGEAICTTISKTVDRNGNITGYHMHRLGSKYEYEYDEYNLLISEYRMSGDEIDRLKYSYNERGDLTQISGNGLNRNFKNFYDHRGRLIKQIEDYRNDSGENERTIMVKEWSSFDKVLSESTYTTREGEVNGVEFPISKKKYEYNDYLQLTRELHTVGERIMKDISYYYYEDGGLWEYVEFDLSKANQETESGRKFESIQTRILYSEKGHVIEEYRFLSDPCMSLDNHFLFEYANHENGLPEKAQVFEDDKLAFYITYEYEFW
jgi:YD repeat-containing protein